MNSSLKEILTTSSIIVENKVDIDELYIVRPTQYLRCTYCGSLRETTVYEKVQYKICCNCYSEIREKLFEFKLNLETYSKTMTEKKRALKDIQMYSKTMENKKRVLEDIIEVGFNPDRTWQTQLADTLYFFKQP